MFTWGLPLFFLVFRLANFLGAEPARESSLNSEIAYRRLANRALTEGQAIDFRGDFHLFVKKGPNGTPVLDEAHPSYEQFQRLLSFYRSQRGKIERIVLGGDYLNGPQPLDQAQRTQLELEVFRAVQEAAGLPMENIHVLMGNHDMVVDQGKFDRLNQEYRKLLQSAVTLRGQGKGTEAILESLNRELGPLSVEIKKRLATKDPFTGKDGLQKIAESPAERLLGEKGRLEGAAFEYRPIPDDAFDKRGNAEKVAQWTRAGVTVLTQHPHQTGFLELSDGKKLAIVHYADVPAGPQLLQMLHPDYGVPKIQRKEGQQRIYGPEVVGTVSFDIHTARNAVGPHLSDGKSVYLQVDPGTAGSQIVAEGTHADGRKEKMPNTGAFMDRFGRFFHTLNDGTPY